MFSRIGANKTKIVGALVCGTGIKSASAYFLTKDYRSCEAYAKSGFSFRDYNNYREKMNFVKKQKSMMLIHVDDMYKTQKMCDIAVDKRKSEILYVPDKFRTHDIIKQAVLGGLIKIEISGKLFNEIFCGMSFVKLTNYNEVHNGFKFKTGLNIDTIKFNPNRTSCRGGIYFIKECDIGNWLRYNDKFMHYKRPVQISDDARIYIEDGKYKVDKFELGEREVIDKNDYMKDDDDYCY